jgi:hypothetical protein
MRFFRLFVDFLIYMSEGGTSSSVEYDPSRMANVTHVLYLVGMYKNVMCARKYGLGNQVRDAVARSRASADPTKVGNGSVM